MSPAEFDTETFPFLFFLIAAVIELPVTLSFFAVFTEEERRKLISQGWTLSRPGRPTTILAKIF